MIRGYEKERKMNGKRRNHGAGFKAKVALAALKRRQGVGRAVGAVSGPSKPDFELEAATSGTGYGCRSENALFGGRPVSFLVLRGNSGAGSV